MEQMRKILDLFKEVDTNPDHQYIHTTLLRLTQQPEEARKFITKMRPGDPAILENAKALLENLFNSRRYNLGKVGRYKVNKNSEMMCQMILNIGL